MSIIKRVVYFYLVRGRKSDPICLRNKIRILMVSLTKNYEICCLMFYIIFNHFIKWISWNVNFYLFEIFFFAERKFKTRPHILLWMIIYRCQHRELQSFQIEDNDSKSHYNTKRIFQYLFNTIFLICFIFISFHKI